MSNYLAIATVTAALAQIVQAAAQQAEPSAVVEVGRPTAPAGGGPANRVYVYLYQASPNAALRNTDLPARDGGGKLTQRPRAALDLHYLLAFYGDQTQLGAERMLGAVVRDLHARPVLSNQAIQDAMASNATLLASDLADSIERVKFAPVPLSLDELSKLWSVFFQTAHALSVVYLATVVLIEAEEGAGPALPVLYRGQLDKGVETLLGPFPTLADLYVCDAVQADVRPSPPSFPAAQMGLRLKLSGSVLVGEKVRVRFDHPLLTGSADFPQMLDPVSATADEIQVNLPAANDAAAQDKWAAGIYTVRAVIARDGKERQSNALPLAMAPRITAIAPPNPIPRVAGDATLTLTCSPQILPKQKALLQLADREVLSEPHATATATLTFVIKDAPAVTAALLRLRVDGVESLPFIVTGTPPALAFDDAQKVTIT